MRLHLRASRGTCVSCNDGRAIGWLCEPCAASNYYGHLNLADRRSPRTTSNRIDLFNQGIVFIRDPGALGPSWEEESWHEITDRLRLESRELIIARFREFEAL